jgi:hypothetical protein
MVGVSYNNRQRKWRAFAKEVYLGSFATEAEAISAHKAYQGEGKIGAMRLSSRPNFSLTESNSIFTMALFPTKRRTKNEAKRDRSVR